MRFSWGTPAPLCSHTALTSCEAGARRQGRGSGDDGRPSPSSNADQSKKRLTRESCIVYWRALRTRVRGFATMIYAVGRTLE